MALWATSDTISQIKIEDMTKFPFYVGGSALAPTIGTAYPSGAGYDKCAPNTDVLNINSAVIVPTWSYKIEAILAIEGGGTVSLALFNLTDAPDTAMVTITSTSATGSRQTSSTITWAGAGIAKDYGVKIKSSSASFRAWAWGIKIIRT